MKVALIASPYPLEEVPSPPLGISYVAAAFEDAGAKVAIFDYIVRKYTPDKIRRELDEFNPDIVGANSVTMNFNEAARVMQTVKRHNPSIITMMGGPHVTFDAESALNRYPEIDMIVIGEGEQTIKELLPVIKDRDAWESINGIAFRKDGKVIFTETRDLIQDLNTLPFPARHLLPISRYLALGYPVSIITSRGCPNRCIYCQGRRMVGQRVRLRSPELVVDEIEEILKFGFARINFADDFFTANKKQVNLICNEIINRGISFAWSAFARADSVTEEMLLLMKKAGCDSVSFGIESGNPEIVKTIRKGITLDKVRRGVECCKNAGMNVFASFMVGLPGETEKSLMDTRMFAEELGIGFGYHYLTPFPGTTVRDEIENFDLEILTDDWDHYDANRPIVRTSHLEPEDISRFVNAYDEAVGSMWDIMEEKFDNGICTDEEFMKVAGSRKLKIIYRLLAEDIIEDYCSYTIENTNADLTMGLLKKIAEKIEWNDDSLIEKTIKDFVKKGYLQYDLKEGTINWFWAQSKAMDCMTVS